MNFFIHNLIRLSILNKRYKKISLVLFDVVEVEESRNKTFKS